MSLLGAVMVFGEVDALEHQKAELLYVSAVLSARSGYRKVARGFGEECIALLRRIGADTPEECATQHTVVYGVALPEYLHADVVRDRLSGYSVTLR